MRSLAVIGLVFFALGSRPLEAKSARILATLPFSGQSQYMFMKTYLKTLVSRDHQLTVINAFENSPTPNMRFVEILKLIDCQK